jgi:Transglutaminase-like superfamily
MRLYMLRPHVRACVDGDHVVFLDLRGDRYSSVPMQLAPAIVELGLTQGGANSAARLEELKLIAPAELTVRSIAPRSRSPTRILEPLASANVSAAVGASILAACAWAGWMLARRRLDRALNCLGAMKRTRRVEVGAATDALAQFEAIRPWFPRERVCLFDSLALARFLISQGFRPEIVLGVRTQPFAAHCWIELDGALVGDRSDHCTSFTPIAWA